MNESDKCIYYKFENGISITICIYVDNIIIFGSFIHVSNDVKSFSCNNFDIKDLGEVSVLLSIKITNQKSELPYIILTRLKIH